MAVTKLTDRYIASIKAPETGRLELSDSVRAGLRLRVAPTGRKTWLYEKRIKGGPKRKYTLGPYPQVSISEARAQATEMELEAIRGIDRAEEQRKARIDAQNQELAVTSVRDVLDIYDRLHIQNLRTAGERRRMLTTALSPFFDRSVKELTRNDLQKIIDAKANHGALVYANRIKAALSHFARFAWTRGYTSENLADGLTKVVRETSRDRVLSLPEMQQIWAATYEETGPFGPLIRLLILTAQRRSDIAELRWSEVDFDRHRIELSGARTKNGKAHITHLSPPALYELQALHRSSSESTEFVFTTNGRAPVSGFSVLKKRLDSRLGADFQPWRFHDFRTAFATAMAEAGEPETLVDRILNHVASGSAPSAVARVYNRSSQLTERARVLDKWAAMLISHAAEVVDLPKRRTDRHAGFQEG